MKVIFNEKRDGVTYFHRANSDGVISVSCGELCGEVFLRIDSACEQKTVLFQGFLTVEESRHVIAELQRGVEEAEQRNIPKPSNKIQDGKG